MECKKWEIISNGCLFKGNPPLKTNKKTWRTISGGLGRVKATIQRAAVALWLLHSQEKLSIQTQSPSEYLQQERQMVFVRSFHGEERDFGLMAQLQQVPSVDGWEVFGLLIEFLGSWVSSLTLETTGVPWRCVGRAHGCLHVLLIPQNSLSPSIPHYCTSQQEHTRWMAGI